MTNAEQHYKKMTETPVSKLIILLGIPTTISMLITSIYNLVDTYLLVPWEKPAGGNRNFIYTAMYYSGNRLYAGAWLWNLCFQGFGG